MHLCYLVETHIPGLSLVSCSKPQFNTELGSGAQDYRLIISLVPRDCANIWMS